jgi:hypothetical protein
MTRDAEVAPARVGSAREPHCQRAVAQRPAAVATVVGVDRCRYRKADPIGDLVLEREHDHVAAELAEPT